MHDRNEIGRVLPTEATERRRASCGNQKSGRRTDKRCCRCVRVWSAWRYCKGEDIRTRVLFGSDICSDHAARGDKRLSQNTSRLDEDVC